MLKLLDIFGTYIVVFAIIIGISDLIQRTTDWNVPLEILIATCLASYTAGRRYARRAGRLPTARKNWAYAFGFAGVWLIVMLSVLLVLGLMTSPPEAAVNALQLTAILFAFLGLISLLIARLLFPKGVQSGLRACDKRCVRHSTKTREALGQMPHQHIAHPWRHKKAPYAQRVRAGLAHVSRPVPARCG